MRIKNWWALHSLLMFEEFQFRKPNMEECRIILESFNEYFKAPRNYTKKATITGPYTLRPTLVSKLFFCVLRAWRSGLQIQTRLGNVSFAVNASRLKLGVRSLVMDNPLMQQRLRLLGMIWSKLPRTCKSFGLDCGGQSVHVCFILRTSIASQAHACHDSPWVLQEVAKLFSLVQICVGPAFEGSDEDERAAATTRSRRRD